MKKPIFFQILTIFAAINFAPLTLLAENSVEEGYVFKLLCILKKDNIEVSRGEAFPTSYSQSSNSKKMDLDFLSPDGSVRVKALSNKTSGQYIFKELSLEWDEVKTSWNNEFYAEHPDPLNLSRNGTTYAVKCDFGWQK